MELASVEGLEGLTLGTLAKDLDISKSNITVLFGSRESLQLAALDAAVEIFRRKVIVPASKKGSPLASLEALCDGWFAYVEHRTFPGGCLVHATSNEYRARSGPVRQLVQRYRDGWIGLLRDLIVNAIEQRELRSDIDPDYLVFKLVAVQAGANVAYFLGDDGALRHARRAVREEIAAARSAVRH